MGRAEMASHAMTTAEFTVLPIAASVDDYAFEVTAQLMNAGLIATVDADSTRTFSTRLREIPDNHYAVIVTQADETNHTIQLRTRSAAPALVLSLQTFIAITTRPPGSPLPPAAAESPTTTVVGQDALAGDCDGFEREFLRPLIQAPVEIQGPLRAVIHGVLIRASRHAYIIEQTSLPCRSERVLIERGPAVSIKAAG